MKKEGSPHIKSGGRRIALYAELGRYFTPDGHFKEQQFREVLREALILRLDQARAVSEESEAYNTVSLWLSGHLEEILAYLLDRDLDRAACLLFEASLEEATALGELTITLSPARMRRIFEASRSAEPEETPLRRRDPDGKRKAIFDAALAVFSEQGYHGATMEDIAKASGVAKGTLYRYFQSKEELLDQLLRSSSQALMFQFAEAFGRDIDILDQIQAFVTLWLAYIEENHTLYRLIQVEGLNSAGGRQTMLYEYLLDDFPMVKERIAALNTAGVLKTPNFYTVAYGLLGFIDGVVRKWFRSGMEYSLQDELPIILEVLFNGFVHESARQRQFYVSPEQCAQSPETTRENEGRTDPQ